MRIHTFASFAFVIALLAVSATSASIAQSPSSAHPDSVMDTPEFMTLMMKPAYVELQHAIERAPADRAAWADIYQKSARLAETANLLFIRQHARADTPEWAARSAGARQAAVDVAESALVGLRSVRPQDFERIRARFGDVSIACNACHREFGGTNAPTIRP
jgi:cytochrome c556